MNVELTDLVQIACTVVSTIFGMYIKAHFVKMLKAKRRNRYMQKKY